jgi:hypothetical protein
LNSEFAELVEEFLLFLTLGFHLIFGLWHLDFLVVYDAFFRGMN